MEWLIFCFFVDVSIYFVVGSGSVFLSTFLASF